MLRLTTRDGVLWSDGRPFTARDVAFTFRLLRRFPALDRRGVWALPRRRARPSTTAPWTSASSASSSPASTSSAAQQIVPEHVWKDVADPVAFPNEHPVATGPFTEVRVFQNQVYELGRNPRYWQQGRPQVEALRFPAYPGNDRANLALVFDEVDWAGNFVPAIDRVYVGRNPEHHRYWFPLTGSSIFLYANTGRAPFDDVRVRKAAQHGHRPRPAGGRGPLPLLAPRRRHRTERRLRRLARLGRDRGAGDWVRHDVARANALLDEAGYRRGADGMRRLPDGRPWRVRDPHRSPAGRTGCGPRR